MENVVDVTLKPSVKHASVRACFKQADTLRVSEFVAECDMVVIVVGGALRWRHLLSILSSVSRKTEISLMGLSFFSLKNRYLHHMF